MIAQLLALQTGWPDVILAVTSTVAVCFVLWLVLR